MLSYINWAYDSSKYNIHRVGIICKKAACLTVKCLSDN